MIIPAMTPSTSGIRPPTTRSITNESNMRTKAPWEKAKSIDVNQLFQLSEIAPLVELAFATTGKDSSKNQIKNRQDVYRALTGYRNA